MYDALTTYANKTAAFAGGLVGNVIDWHPNGVALDPGIMSDMSGIEIFVTADFGTGTSVEFQFRQASNAALTSDVVVLASSGAIIIADLVVGKRILRTSDYVLQDQFTGIFTVNVGSPVAGTIHAAHTGVGITAGVPNLGGPLTGPEA